MKHIWLFTTLALLLLPLSAAAQLFLPAKPPPDTTRPIPTASQLEVPIETEPFWLSAECDEYSTGLIWTDCNNDGYIDAFFSNGNDIVLAQNFIYLSNEGSLPASASWFSSNAEYSGHCAVGDIDDNGYPDLIVSNFLGSGGFSTGNLLNLYLNPDGLPNTDPDWYSADSMFSFSCALGDVDNDGDLDLAVATGTGYTDTYTSDYVYFNVDGVLQDEPGWQSTPQTAAMDVTWGDVDNDGDLDLAFCYDYEGAAVYYNDDGVIETTPSWRSINYQAANTIIFGDINGDGWLDLIVAFNYQLTTGGYFRVYFNDGAGNLDVSPGWQSATAGNGSALALYDYDNDGDNDLAAGRWFSRLHIYENTGTNLTAAHVWESEPEIVAEELAWVDIDGYAVERLADTFYADGSRSLFYTLHQPLYSVDSVMVDDALLNNAGYCYDLVSGWISLAAAPADSAVVYYGYSFCNDLTVSNWDTCNMAFASTFDKVQMFADTTVGWVPAEIQFSDSTNGASQWMWHFGDGDSSDQKDPIHTYQVIGQQDVTLKVLLADGWNQRTIDNWITVLADTIIGSNQTGNIDSTVELTVYARNTQPVNYMRIPVHYGGSLPLEYKSYSTDGCRTEYFANQSLRHWDPANHRVTLRLNTANDGSQPELEPGYGPIVKLYFKILSSALPDETSPISFESYTTYLLEFSGSVLAYEPKIDPGSITSSCCLGMRGNLDGDASEEVTISDLTWFIEWMLDGGPPPPCPAEADVDGSGQVDVEDAVYLVKYLYGSGPEPVGCH